MKNINVRIGLFAIGAFVIICFGLNYLKGRDLFFSGSKYYGFFANVDGLTDASPVFYSGFKVGSVRDIEISPTAKDINKRFKVTLAVEINLDIPRNTTAEIYSTDILGGKGIELIFGNQTELLEEGDTLHTTVRPELMQQILPMKDKAEILIERVDSALQGVNNLLGGANGDKLSQAIDALTATMVNFQQLSNNMARLTSTNGSMTNAIANLDSLMSKLNQQGANIDTTLSGMAKFASDLSRSDIDNTIGYLNDALLSLNAIMQQADSAQGTIGKFLNDSGLYDNLATSSENLNRLLIDVRLNPSRYINISALDFGKNIYFSDPTIATAMVGTAYSVSIAKVKQPMNMPIEIEENRVIEYFDGKRYNYLVGIFDKENKARELFEKLKSQYKDAAIVAYENGVEMSTKK